MCFLTRSLISPDTLTYLSQNAIKRMKYHNCHRFHSIFSPDSGSLFFLNIFFLEHNMLCKHGVMWVEIDYYNIKRIPWVQSTINLLLSIIRVAENKKKSIFFCCSPHLTLSGLEWLGNIFDIEILLWKIKNTYECKQMLG